MLQKISAPEHLRQLKHKDKMQSQNLRRDPLKLQSTFKTLAFLNSSNALIVADNEHEDTKKLVK